MAYCPGYPPTLMRSYFQFRGYPTLLLTLAFSVANCICVP